MSRPPTHRSSVLGAVGAAVAVIVTVVALGSSSGSSVRRADAAQAVFGSLPASATASPPSGSAATPRPTTTPQPTATSHAPAPPTRAQLRARAERAVARISAHQPAGSVSVAAVNTATGVRFVAGARSGMWTASAYKLFVLETLLWQQGGPLTGYEDAEAEPMIENSDNKAGYSLFLAAGGNAGLEAAARKFGMTHTVPGVSDPTFTRTGAADFLKLARNLVGPGPLTPAAQAYARSLMRDVESDQRWGVGVVADDEHGFYNKNGWLSVDDSNGPGEDDDGRWAVTSIGVVTVHHQRLLMSVFTQHQPDMGTGVRLVEKLARTVARAVVRPHA